MINKASGATVSTERVIPFSPLQVFAAFEQPDQLAVWWGPNGFSNTFQHFDFKPGGRWIFTMHGPNGVNYPNESIFHDIQPGRHITIEHIPQPWFRLTVNLCEQGTLTHLSWVQEFESAEAAEKLRPLVEPANEQVLDRLQALLTETTS